MKRILGVFVFAFLAFFSYSLDSRAQDHTDEYIKVTNERARKIVDGLNLNDRLKETRVQEIIARQYRDLNAIHEDRDQRKDHIKATFKGNEDRIDKEIEKVQKKADKQVAALHKSFIKKLRVEISEKDIEGVKDGLTYHVLPITYDGYVEMLPQLTQKQKDKIMEFLVEAREIAMDAGSSHEKHAVFGKYKGKINNYLSAEGVETKKAREVWEKKLKEGQTNKK